MNLQNKVILVTGAGRGIGRGLALNLARAGAALAIASRTKSELESLADEIRHLGGTAKPFPLDVRDVEACRRVVAAIIEEMGRLDGLVHSAGTTRRKPIDEYTEEDWDLIHDSNLKSSFFLSREVARVMRRQGSGSIVLISSILAHHPVRGVSPYVASKGGVSALTRALALEYAGYGIRVNCISPGFILTPLTEKVWNHPQRRAAGNRRVPLGRIGVPDDLSGAVILLLSDEAAYITGADLLIDGGYTGGDPTIELRTD